MGGFFAWLDRILPPPADGDLIVAWAPRSWPRILPPPLLDFPPAGVPA